MTDTTTDAKGAVQSGKERITFGVILERYALLILTALVIVFFTVNPASSKKIMGNLMMVIVFLYQMILKN